MLDEHGQVERRGVLRIELSKNTFQSISLKAWKSTDIGYRLGTGRVNTFGSVMLRFW